jgi:hypothetical protein
MKTEPFKLGPLQEQWLQSLEQHPERQTTNALGRKIYDGYKACCLGEAAIICGVAKWNALNRLTAVYKGDESDALFKGHNLLGLYDCRGQMNKTLRSPTQPEKECDTLALMNDRDFTWPQIAAEIRKDPTNFFTESK